MPIKKISFVLVLLAACAVACAPAQIHPAEAASATMTLPQPMALTPTAPSAETAPASTGPAPLPSATSLAPEAWQIWPVIPEKISPRVLEIYRRGVELGNNPQAFSKIGDCEATPTWFLGAFDADAGQYALGDYDSLATVITYFHGSYGRTSVAAGRGFSAANLLTPLWADHKVCRRNETPLACEVRIQRPAFALVMLGTNDVNRQATFDKNMHVILDFLIEQGVVPVLATKADNLEGGHVLNQKIARLAAEYDIPLWNFWKIAQALPNSGLQPDGAHLTWAGPYFDNLTAMQAAWPWRNLTALQMLDTLLRAVENNR
ncbi:MAG: hypothetical protein CO094_03590 [Anaerolineae bacterium CG_4_9_14_3_um_filter_57_17]|nr:hypothetical protein [bacterium]NCT19561.1 hypothetical protein [bacterium]OIO85143.1 MAG: hypothetical protein AUK01_06945 [Anaerolineae bacterium CG2_30_57_67]PJB67626.1 MAG: hypothetical protein CO094_03590 [Anaerolineae bacterium CG_4_9_14_3_um_filter_57_17]